MHRASCGFMPPCGITETLSDVESVRVVHGFIHCQDEFSDWETYQRNGVYDYLLQMKDEGVVKHIGLSSHTPAVIQKIMDELLSYYDKS